MGGAPLRPQVQSRGRLVSAPHACGDAVLGPAVVPNQGLALALLGVALPEEEVTDPAGPEASAFVGGLFPDGETDGGVSGVALACWSINYHYTLDSQPGGRRGVGNVHNQVPSSKRPRFLFELKDDVVLL